MHQAAAVDAGDGARPPGRVTDAEWSQEKQVVPTARHLRQGLSRNVATLSGREAGVASACAPYKRFLEWNTR